jgi:hypothetical protein
MTTNAHISAPNDAPTPRDRANTPANRVPASSSTSFEPRRFIALPAQFGKSSIPLVAAADVRPDDPRVFAAQLQHLACNALRESLLAAGLTTEAFAKELGTTTPGMGYDRLSRIMRGKTVVQITDLLAWAKLYERVGRVLVQTTTWQTARAAQDERDYF